MKYFEVAKNNSNVYKGNEGVILSNESTYRSITIIKFRYAAYLTKESSIGTWEHFDL